MYQGEILYDADGNKVRGKWEPILTEEEYEAITGEMEAGSAGSVAARGDREGVRDGVPSVAVRAVRQMQCEDAGGRRSDKQARATSRVLPVPGQRRKADAAAYRGLPHRSTSISRRW